MQVGMHMLEGYLQEYWNNILAAGVHVIWILIMRVIIWIVAD